MQGPVRAGTVNLDAWAPYRNSEITMIARSREAAALFEERLFTPDIARARPGQDLHGRMSVSRAGSATSSYASSERRSSMLQRTPRRGSVTPRSRQGQVGSLSAPGQVS
jgi:hypothetical protein